MSMRMTAVICWGGIAGSGWRSPMGNQAVGDLESTE